MNVRETPPNPPTWASAWISSSFWARESPAHHFHTFATIGPVFAETVAATARAFGLDEVVDVGAGDGALARRLAASAPGGLAVTGIDQRPAPPDFPGTWITAVWNVTTAAWEPAAEESAAGLAAISTRPALVVALEWLDDLAAPVVVRRADGWRHVRVDGRDGPHVSAADAAWLARWWSGPRGEVGRSRDAAWAWWARHAAPGSVLLLVDYGHLRATRRPTFRGYRAGVPVPPTPEVNLTAHVAIDAVDAAVRAAGAERVRLSRVREVVAAAPEVSGTGLAAIAARGERAFYAGPAGDLWWMCHTVGELATMGP